MEKFTIVAPLSALSRRTRLFKISKFIHQNIGVKVRHIGWERIPNEAEEKNLGFEIEKEIILRGGGYGGSKIKLYYLFWMFKVFIQSFSIGKNEVVWALGFESAFPLLIASKIKGYKLYFDDADRFSMLFNFPSPITLIIEYLEKVTSRHVYKHVIPVKERYNFASSRFHILQNFPSKTEIDLGRRMYMENAYVKNKVVVNVNGWLGANRGMDIILELCKRKIEGVSFILAGKLDCKEAQEIVSYKNVQYLGEVTNAEALASYYASDFVFTFYKPNSVINTLAASNKWGDAIMTGIGIIVNEEVKTANYLFENSIAFKVRYSDTNSLTNFLEEMVKKDFLKEKYKVASTTYGANEGYFESQLMKLIN